MAYRPKLRGYSLSPHSSLAWQVLLHRAAAMRQLLSQQGLRLALPNGEKETHPPFEHAI